MTSRASYFPIVERKNIRNFYSLSFRRRDVNRMIISPCLFIIMTIIVNPEYDTEIKCIWCGHEFVLPAYEIWYKPYICIKCGNIIGHFAHTVCRYNGKRIVYSYRFRVRVSKSQVMPFLSKLMENDGNCKSVWKMYKTDKRSKWEVIFTTSKCFHMEGVKWELPIRWVAA